MEIPRQPTDNPGSRVDDPEALEKLRRRSGDDQRSERRAPDQPTPADERAGKSENVPGNSLGEGGQQGVKV